MPSEIIYKEFKPTYLIIKQHSVTGLKYLCKTTRKDPVKYNGSGKYWIRHLKKHGKDLVVTLWVSKLYVDKDELVRTALALSEMYDVTDSDAWANMKPENGLDGATSEQARKNNEKRVTDGTHNLLGNGDFKRKVQQKRIENGTHNLFDGELTRKRVTDGTHNWLGSDSNRKRIENGTHNFLGGRINKIKNSRPNVIRLRELSNRINIKLGCGWTMKSDAWINSKIEEIHSTHNIDGIKCEN